MECGFCEYLWYWPRTLRITLHNNGVCSCEFALQTSKKSTLECQGEAGETHVNKVKSIGGAAYAKTKTPFRGNTAARALALHFRIPRSAWRLRYAH